HLHWPPPTPTLFPYTTLFRSRRVQPHGGGEPARPDAVAPGGGQRILLPVASGRTTLLHGLLRYGKQPEHAAPQGHPTDHGQPPRSEEHTSELQSRVDLVCRLL